MNIISFVDSAETSTPWKNVLRKRFCLLTNLRCWMGCRSRLWLESKLWIFDSKPTGLDNGHLRVEKGFPRSPCTTCRGAICINYTIAWCISDWDNTTLYEATQTILVVGYMTKLLARYTCVYHGVLKGSSRIQIWNVIQGQIIGFRNDCDVHSYNWTALQVLRSNDVPSLYVQGGQGGKTTFLRRYTAVLCD